MKKMMMGAMLMVYASVSLAAASPLRDKPVDKKQAGFMQKSMAMTRLKLSNPQSAQFRDVFFHTAENGASVTCGEVKSKNQQGQFGGFQKFVSAGTADLTFLQAEVPGFDQIWKQYCS